ncbi:MAG: biopolymer transporter ExbD [Citrobacter freundii]|nr:MAG: biopolymer transporter ExbD [Citrobacter freundii]
MKFRKKHREQSEVFTDSLNDILFILLMFFLITTTMANPNVVKVNNPRGTRDTKAKQNIVVSINKDQKFFIGQRPVESGMLDSFLIQEIRRAQATVDTPSVVINADSIAYYGEVFRVMKLAKSAGARPLGVVK